MALDPIYTEVILDTPTVFTPAVAATAQPMYAVPFKYVFSFIIRVRDMGTATYVRIGNAAAQEYSLTVVGQTYEWHGHTNQVCDMGKLWVLSDTNDAVLEIVAEYVPHRPTRQVIEVEGRGK